MRGGIRQKNVCKKRLIREILWGEENENRRNVEKTKVRCFRGSAFHIQGEIIGCPREIKKLHLFKSN